MDPRRASAGFTLVELVVTVTIFSILLAATVPSMSVWVRNSRVRAVADTLQNGLRLAQAEALRRSRQTVFSLTNSSTPQNGYTAVANGTYWAITTVPAMLDGSEVAQFVSSGILSTGGAAVAITGPAQICFNSAGRLVANPNPPIAGGACTVPATGINSSAQPMLSYAVTAPGADHPLQVEIALGGQVRLCDPSQALTGPGGYNPYGC